MTVRVLALGAGFAGLELAASLTERMGDDVEVTLVDRNDAFVFGFAKLDVMFGHRSADSVRHRYDTLRRPGVRFVQAEIQAIDPARRAVQTSVGELTGDVLVVALGADLDVDATPGLADGGHDFYTTDGAFAAKDALDAFEGGRVVIGVAGPVFKCPPAPSEMALLVDDLLRRRGLREKSEVALVAPLPAPIPPVPAASQGLLDAFAERGILWHAKHTIASVDAAAHEVVFADGHRLGYDLFLSVPVHVAPPVVADSPLSDGGWIPVDHETFATGFDGVYAVGDVAATGTPKAGVFAAGQAAVVAARIAAAAGHPGDVPAYDGAGICYVGFGGPDAAKVDVTFAPGLAPQGSFASASPAIAAEKERYRTETAARWFGA